MTVPLARDYSLRPLNRLGLCGSLVGGSLIRGSLGSLVGSILGSQILGNLFLESLVGECRSRL